MGYQQLKLDGGTRTNLDLHKSINELDLYKSGNELSLDLHKSVIELSLDLHILAIN